MSKSNVFWITAVLAVCLANVRAEANGNGHDDDDDNPFVGAWTCEVTRPGSPLPRPISYAIHADGIASYSSQTNLKPNYDSRTGGRGDWARRSRRVYNVRTVEHLYWLGNAAGRFLVDLDFKLTSNRGRDPDDDVLCSGNRDQNEDDPCPVGGNVRLTQYRYLKEDGTLGSYKDDAFAGAPISFEADQFEEFHPRIRCVRLARTRAYGKAGDIFPIPTRTPIP